MAEYRCHRATAKNEGILSDFRAAALNEKAGSSSSPSLWSQKHNAHFCRYYSVQATNIIGTPGSLSLSFTAPLFHFIHLFTGVSRSFTQMLARRFSTGFDAPITFDSGNKTSKGTLGLNRCFIVRVRMHGRMRVFNI